MFANRERADKAVYETGDFHGPNLEQCVERLEEIGVEISEPHWNQLGVLSSKRKKFEHFRITDSIEAVTALTADVLSFLVDFIASELAAEPLDEEHAGILDTIRSKLSEFQTFVDARWMTIESEVKGADTVVACPTCLEEAWVIEDGVVCKFCGYRVDDSLDASEEYITQVLGEDKYITFKEGGEWPKHKCPGCGWHTLVDREYVEHGAQYICFQCGAAWEPGELSECSSCGQPFEAADIAMCDDCFNDRVSKD